MGKPPNELFRKRLIADFCNDTALKDGANCLALLNKAHHRDKSKISYKDVKDEAANLRRLRGRIEDVHEEFRRWKWRDAASPPSNIVPLLDSRPASKLLNLLRQNFMQRRQEQAISTTSNQQRNLPRRLSVHSTPRNQECAIDPLEPKSTQDHVDQTSRQLKQIEFTFY